jgi:glutamate-1-semialdehyde 2,1-aminomutase
MGAYPTSKELYNRALRFIPAGVTRPFRFFEPHPFYVKRAYGAKLVDFEGREYVDFWEGHGALVLGHMHPSVLKAVREQMELGFHFGLCNEWEVRLAERVSTLVPSVEMMRFNNSGTEANMHAIRLARAYTRRSKIGKFEGHFHGAYDPLFSAVSWPFDESESAGLDPLALKNTVILPFNDLEATCRVVRSERLACVILEAVQGGYAFPADRDFLKGLKEVCEETGTLLVFDEVITGFRLAAGGAQEVYGVTPDLTTFGKAIGGGEFPVGAVGGRRDIMELMDNVKHPRKSEQVAQGGTYSGNPLVMRAGYEAMAEYESRTVYSHINRLGERLKAKLEEAVQRSGANAYVSGIGSMVKVHFTKGEVDSFDLKSLMVRSDRETESRYFRHLISNGILAMIPNRVHFFISLPHQEEDIDRLVDATESFLRRERRD